MYANLRQLAGDTIARAERAFFDACDRAEQVVDAITEHVEAAAGYVGDGIAYRRAQVRATHALGQITAAATYSVQVRAEWMRSSASAQRELAALHERIAPDRCEPGRDGLTTPQVLRYAADLADALADADVAEYRRTLHLGGSERPTTLPEEIERIAGERLDRPHCLHNGQFPHPSELDQLIAELRPVCGRAAQTLAVLRGHPTAA